RLFWPVGLSADYAYNAFPLVENWSDPRLWAGGAALVAMLAALVWSMCSRRRAAIFICLALALPQMALAAQIPIRTGILFAERMLYLPAAALAILAASLLVPAISRLPAGPARRIAPWLAGCFLL